MKDDTISRQAAIETVRKAKDKSEAHRMLVQLPSATDTNVGGNLIDREAAISEIMEDIKDRSLHDDPATPEDYAEGYDEGIRNAAAIVLQMPSAQPEHLCTVMERIKEKYAKAMNTPCIHNPMAWALYQVWKEYDK